VKKLGLPFHSAGSTFFASRSAFASPFSQSIREPERGGRVFEGAGGVAQRARWRFLISDEVL
jgi:hypothetical protein